MDSLYMIGGKLTELKFTPEMRNNLRLQSSAIRCNPYGWDLLVSIGRRGLEIEDTMYHPVEAAARYFGGRYKSEVEVLGFEHRVERLTPEGRMETVPVDVFYIEMKLADTGKTLNVKASLELDELLGDLSMWYAVIRGPL